MLAQEVRPTWRRVSSRFALLLVLVGLCGCALQLVADYDAVAYDQAIELAKKVDRFYGDLLETDATGRKYNAWAARYVEIEADLRSQLMRNQARPLNAESTEISQIILDKWLKYKDQHKAKNKYSDGKAKLDRGRFQRLFTSALKAESAKDLGTEDAEEPADGDEG